jgi:hypothetical protein
VPCASARSPMPADEQDRGAQVGEGRPGGPGRSRPLRAGRVEDHRRGRQGAPQVGGGLHAPPDARTRHDAHPHAERRGERLAGAPARPAHARVGADHRRCHHAPAAPAPLGHRGAGARDHAAPRGGGAVEPPDGDGQYPRHHRLPGHRPHPRASSSTRCRSPASSSASSSATRSSPTCRESSTSPSPGAASTARAGRRRTSR